MSKSPLKVTRPMAKLLQFIGFKLSWFGLILFPMLALWPVLVYWIWSLWRLSAKSKVAVLMITAMGGLMDIGLVQIDVFKFLGSNFLPLWMWMLWGCFALVLVQVLAAMLKHWWLAALLGAVSGPLAYWGGAALGGQLIYANTQEFLLTLAPCWALLLAVIVYFQFLWSEQDEPTSTGKTTSFGPD
jgi:hypothetical protein